MKSPSTHLIDLLIPLVRLTFVFICAGFLIYNGTQMIYRDIVGSGTAITLNLLGFQVSATDIGLAVIIIGAFIIYVGLAFESRIEKSRDLDGRENCFVSLNDKTRKKF